MGDPTKPTRAARRFRFVVILGAGVLSISAFLPWYRISGFTYTFFDVDGWKVLPIAELAIAAGSVVAALVRVARIKRIGLVLGGGALVLNVSGAFAAGRLANIHNPDPYYRIWTVTSIAPAWGGFVALVACAVLIVGASSRWSACHSLRATTERPGRPLYQENPARKDVHGIPMQSHIGGDDS